MSSDVGRPSRAGSVCSAVRKAVRAARTEGRIAPHDEPVVALAEVVARQLDQAAGAASAGEVVRLTRSLRDLLADLPLRPERIPPRGDDRPAGPAAGVDPVELELAQLVGAGPSVGDAAHA